MNDPRQPNLQEVLVAAGILILILSVIALVIDLALEYAR